MTELNVVTGAFSYTGKYITRRLLALGIQVKSLTGHPNQPNPFDQPVVPMPYAFDEPDRLEQSLRGATTLYNTYWVRFPYGGVSHDQAVRNTITLFQAAKAAGVKRVVHVSIANADASSPLPYYRGKGEIEAALIASGLSYAILRPTVVFGPEDILINNIAWILRRLPVFGLPGSGAYGVEPIFVEDLADLAVSAALRSENLTLDAVGPETYSFAELVQVIAQAVGSRSRIIHLPPLLAWSIAHCVGWAVKDVLLTRDEVAGLMADLLISHQAPTGSTLLSGWLREHATTLGAKYPSELQRHYPRPVKQHDIATPTQQTR